MDCDEQEVYERLLGNTAHLWVNEDSAGVTEVTDAGYLHIWQCGGTLRGLLQMLLSVEAFAEALECKGLIISGRRGWSRVLSRHGYIFKDGHTVKTYGR
ncbi:MAG: hypothetical protein NVV72_15775 [Asticcacaulis sp.]|nr:hypothetical protein [Asticcacaulis sp.]